MQPPKRDDPGVTRAPGRELSRWCILAVGRAGVRARALPTGGALTIGRGEDVDLRLEDSTISRRHAQIRLSSSSAEEVIIHDLGSSFGTRVGGERLEPGSSASVGPGDVIELGATIVLLQPRALLEVVAPELSEPTATTMEAVLALAERVAPSDINVLLTGETGVGKSRLARRIHDRSPRSRAPFLELECVGMARAELERELFGQDGPGLLESADGGTVYLDQVNMLPPTIQAALARVIGDGRVRRAGERRSRVIDVRYISSSHDDLGDQIARGEFREDLFYRLDGVWIEIPPLRSRLDEIPSLVREFIAIASRRNGRAVLPLHDSAIKWLKSQVWDGNIRELRNATERTFALCYGDVLTGADFRELAGPTRVPPRRRARRADR